MKNPLSRSLSSLRAVLLAALACSVAWLPAAAGAQQMESGGGGRSCSLEGAWLGQADGTSRFFAHASGGALDKPGALTLDSIDFDPTLFGAFYDASVVTAGIGTWQRTGRKSYDYTWIAYGIDILGFPVYSIRVSGSGHFRTCDVVEFDYVIEIFPGDSFDPLTSSPAACVPGSGILRRIPVMPAAACVG